MRYCTLSGRVFKSVHVLNFLNNFYVDYRKPANFSETIWTLIVIVFTKNELSYIKIMLGIWFFRFTSYPKTNTNVLKHMASPLVALDFIVSGNNVVLSLNKLSPCADTYCQKKLISLAIIVPENNVLIRTDRQWAQSCNTFLYSESGYKNSFISFK